MKKQNKCKVYEHPKMEFISIIYANMLAESGVGGGVDVSPWEGEDIEIGLAKESDFVDDEAPSDFIQFE